MTLPKGTILTAPMKKLMKYAQQYPQIQQDVGWIIIGTAERFGFKSLIELLKYMYQYKPDKGKEGG